VGNPKVLFVVLTSDSVNQKPEQILEDIAKAKRPLCYLSNSDQSSATFRSALLVLHSKLENLYKSVLKSSKTMESLVKEASNIYSSPIISYDDFKNLGILVGINGSLEMSRCAKVLHEYGHVIHFPAVDKLNEIVIVQPEIIYDLVKTLFNSNLKWLVKNGFILASQLNTIWKEFPQKIIPDVILLFKKFNLLHEIQILPRIMKHLAVSRVEELQSETPQLIYYIPALESTCTADFWEQVMLHMSERPYKLTRRFRLTNAANLLSCIMARIIVYFNYIYYTWRYGLLGTIYYTTNNIKGEAQVLLNTRTDIEKETYLKTVYWF